MLLLPAVQGWYPLLPLPRRMGFRTVDEINQYALEAVQGDSEQVKTAETQQTG
jgi:hypothetical protein